VDAADAADLRVLADILARAFRDNPLNEVVIGGDPVRRFECNALGMRALLPIARQWGVLLAARRGANAVGGLVAAPAHAYPLPPSPLATRLRLFWGQGWRVASRWNRVFEALDAVHPREPHWYLGTLGVDPPSQGQGVGRALLRAFVLRADADALPAYLETDRASNVSFYQSAGFAVRGETCVLGARIWRMLRPARAV
jgi:GNAT superfamily N-acetyltransferase